MDNKQFNFNTVVIIYYRSYFLNKLIFVLFECLIVVIWVTFVIINFLGLTFMIAYFLFCYQIS